MFLKCTQLCRKKIFLKMTWTKHDYEPPLKLSGKSAKIFHALVILPCEHSYSPFRSHNPMIIKSYHIKVIALAHISNPPKSKNHSYLVIESESECFLFIGSRNRRRVTWTMLVLSSRVLVLRQMGGSNIWQILTNIHWENIFKYQQ